MTKEQKMNEQDKNLIISLWKNGTPTTTIIKLLPYKQVEIKREIAELRQNGVLNGRSGKTRGKTREKVLQAYKDGITNPYELAEMFRLKPSTISSILVGLGLNRTRPKHNYKKTKKCEKTETILQEIKEGNVLCEIARKHGVSRQYVHKVKKKWGVDNAE